MTFSITINIIFPKLNLKMSESKLLKVIFCFISGMSSLDPIKWTVQKSEKNKWHHQFPKWTFFSGRQTWSEKSSSFSKIMETFYDAGGGVGISRNRGRLKGPQTKWSPTKWSSTSTSILLLYLLILEVAAFQQNFGKIGKSEQTKNFLVQCRGKLLSKEAIFARHTFAWFDHNGLLLAPAIRCSLKVRDIESLVLLLGRLKVANDVWILYLILFVKILDQMFHVP